MLDKLEELDVFGRNHIPKKFPRPGFASDSFDKSRAAETKVLHFDLGIFAFEGAENSADDGAAGERAVPDDLAFLFSVFKRRGRWLGKREVSPARRENQGARIMMRLTIDIGIPFLNG